MCLYIRVPFEEVYGSIFSFLFLNEKFRNSQTPELSVISTSFLKYANVQNHEEHRSSVASPWDHRDEVLTRLVTEKKVNFP